MKKFIILVMLCNMMLQVRVSAQAPNFDFSMGNFTNWGFYVGRWLYGNVQRYPVPINIVGRHQLLDRAVLEAQQNGIYGDYQCTSLKLIPDGYNYSCKLGNNMTDAELEGIYYRMIVTPDNALLTINFATVLNNNWHALNEQPMFVMELTDTNNNLLNISFAQVIFNQQFDLTPFLCAESNLEGSDWKCVHFNLQPLIGQTIQINLESRDCSQSGHFGYAYVVPECFPIYKEHLLCPSEDKIVLRSAQSFSSYSWTRSSSSTWTRTGINALISDPVHNDTVSCYMVDPLSLDTIVQHHVIKILSQENISLLAEVVPSADSNNIFIGDTLPQTIKIKNTSSINIEDAILTVNIKVSDTIWQRLTDTITTIIAAKDSLGYTLSNRYVVPSVMNYQIEAMLAYAGCDSSFGDTAQVITETTTQYDMAVVEIVNPSGIDPDTAGNDIFIEVKLRNNASWIGTPPIVIHALVYDSNETVLWTKTDTIYSTIAEMSAYIHTFSQSYQVPAEDVYFVKVYLDEYDGRTNDDTILTQRQTTTHKCDLNISEILMPTGTSPDNIGDNIFIEVKVNNHSLAVAVAPIVLHALVYDASNPAIFSSTDTINGLAIGEEYAHTFGNSYQVPAVSSYFVKVYLDQYEDSRTDNDTIIIQRQTPNLSIDPIPESGFYLYQNVPNPAFTSTQIDYTLPQNGHVLFEINSITGQVLFSRTIKSHSGRNSLKVDISQFSAGVYSYSVEFEGKKVVKKMMVKK